MKHIIALLCFISVIGCKKDSNISNFDKSYSAWLSFKKNSDNSYQYTVLSGSVFGFGSETKITVVNGVVTGRVYLAYSLGQAGEKITIESWTETSDDLNSHSSGAKSQTLDEVYATAKSDWLRADKKNNTVYFEANNDGLISSCGYVPNGCMDDCFSGITIGDISVITSEN